MSVIKYKICDKGYKIIDNDYFLDYCCKKNNDGYITSDCKKQWTCDTAINTANNLMIKISGNIKDWVNKVIDDLENKANGQECNYDDEDDYEEE